MIVGFKPVDSFSERELQRELTLLAPAAVQRAQRSAVSRTLTQSRTQISRQVREHLALKAKRVNEALDIRRPARHADPVAGRIKISPKPIPLKEYGARQVRKGVSYRMFRQGDRSRNRNAFIVGSLGGHAFVRAGKARLPIKKLYGPSVLWSVERQLPAIEKRVEGILEKNLSDRLEWEVKKYYRRAARR